MLSLPGEAVGVGSSWENAFTLPLPLVGSMTVATSHELESLDEELAVIHSSGTMGLADDALASALTTSSRQPPPDRPPRSAVGSTS